MSVPYIILSSWLSVLLLHCDVICDSLGKFNETDC